MLQSFLNLFSDVTDLIYTVLIVVMAAIVLFTPYDTVKKWLPNVPSKQAVIVLRIVFTVIVVAVVGVILFTATL
ncbi:MAG: hypothetical protein OSJ72_16195 [Lachnospiraceae bacterium]|nr:hypothetical protein [Lachnospiraceae bacterium]